MCYVCKKYPGKPRTPGEAKRIAVEVAERIAAGADPAHFEDLLDRLTGTGLKERDGEAERDYEERRRSGA